jgi:hypothetical protein
VPSPALARSSLALCGPTLCGPIGSSCRAVSGVGPNWRPRHGPIACFSGRASTTPKTARWADARPDTTTQHRSQGRGAAQGVVRRKGRERRRRRGHRGEGRGQPRMPPPRPTWTRGGGGGAAPRPPRREGSVTRLRPPVGRCRGHRGRGGLAAYTADG